MFPCLLRQLSSRLLSLLLLGLIAPFPPVQADEEEEKSSPSEAEISEHLLVTAHRIPLPESRVGSSVSLLDREALERRPTEFLVDLLRGLPGVAVSRTSTLGSLTSVRVRGAEANHLLVLIDGVKANDPASGNEFDFTSLTGFHLERVELIRGPQSALWGAEASAGVLNIRTRLPRRPFSLDAELEAGSENTHAERFRLAAEGGKAAVSLQGSRFSTDGISAAAAGTERDGYENRTSGVRLLWEPSNRVRFNLALRDLDNRLEYDGFDFTIGLPGDANLHSENGQRTLAAQLGFQAADSGPDHELRARRLVTDQIQYADGNRNSSVHAERTTFGYLGRLPLSRAGDGRNRHLSWLLEREQARFRQTGAAGFFGDPNQRQSIASNALAVEYLTSPRDSLTLSFGLRQDWHDNFGDILTLRSTVSWRFAEGLRLHASHGKGQTAPTFTELFGFFPGQFVGNPDLQPERSESRDLGLEMRLFENRLLLDATWFRERLHDEINGFARTTIQSASGERLSRMTAENLDGTSRREGVELYARARRNNTSLTGSYTFTNSRQPGADGFERELRRPRHQASLNLHQGFGAAWQANLNLSWTGRQLDSNFPDTVLLDDYLLVGVTLQYQVTQRVQLQLRSENLLDEKYTDVFGYQAPERSVLFALKISHSP